MNAHYHRSKKGGGEWEFFDLPEEETLNWPRYGRVAREDYREDLQNATREYADLMTMCDVHLGLILDFMDCLLYTSSASAPR